MSSTQDVDQEFPDSEFAMVEHDDLVEVRGRRAVSSGEPSLDGSIDEERAALSDSDIQHVARTSTIAKQVKGPSSDDLEGACRMEHEARERGDEWQDLLGSKQLWRKVLRRGSGEKPRDGQWITLRIVDTLRGVDSHEHLTAILGFGMLIDAWELCVKMMHEGEVCGVRADARFAYGELGQDTIPGGQQQEYTLELLEIGSSPTFSNMSEDELTEFILMVKDRGNHYFNRKELEKAIFVYKRATDLVEVPESEPLRKLFSALHSNLAVCYAKLEDWQCVLDSTAVSLDLHPNNTKALFRRACALSARHEVEQAMDCLRQAAAIDPSDAAVQREMERLGVVRKRRREQERSMYKKMLSGAGDATSPPPPLSPHLRFAIAAFSICMFLLFVYFLAQM